MCSVPQCTNHAILGKVSLHHFPKKKKPRTLRAIKLRIGKQVSEEMVVCSEHFNEDFFWGHLVEECQTRWRTIRDTYLKRKKRRRSDAKGQWNVLDRELSFLDEFLRPRTRRCSLRALPMPPVKSEVPDGDPREASGPEEAANNWAPLPQQPVAILPHHQDGGGAALQERAGDPDELFCLSLSAQLKRLLPRERNLAKMKMLRVLHNLEFGQVEDEADIGP
ncbi:uncharacterized protein [Dermacentor andersoni]|uniref:uncharacterized protein isoform X1 n=1 Tax=Dermacentor andersoni TaxID=34620 RepID=UPI002416283B|nr:uncharacterized protein LOC126545138 isoform X1 [Dermacentor andersoni]